MFERFSSFIPEGIQARVAAAAEDVKRRTAGVRKVASEKAAGVRKVASERTAGIINTVKEQNPNFIVQGQKILEQGKKTISNAMASSTARTDILTEENFKAELKKMKEKFLIILTTQYNIPNPDIDCLIKGGYVKIEKNWISTRANTSPFKETWKERWNVIMPSDFYAKFDDLITTTEITLWRFMDRLYLKYEAREKLQLRMRVDQSKLEPKNEVKIDITKVCQPAAGGASTASRSRRRSSRKNYRKSVRSVKRAARSGSGSGSGTRKYRNRSYIRT